MSHVPEGVSGSRLLRARLRPGVLWQSELIRFGAVGAFNTAFGYALFVVLFLAVGHQLPYLGVLVVAFLASTVVAFMLHRRLTFRHTGSSLTAAVKYLLIQLGVLALNGALLAFLVEIVNLRVLVAQFSSLVVIVAASYLAHRHITFRPGSSSSS